MHKASILSLWLLTMGPNRRSARLHSRPESQENFVPERQSASDRHQQAVPEARTSSNKRLRRCDLCSYTSNRTSNVIRHIEKLHDELQETEYCCNKEFTTRHDFIKHREEVHPDGDYVCSVDGCAKSFAKRSLLERHIKAHRKEFTHICKPCKYETVIYSNFQRHRISARCLKKREISPTEVAEEDKERESVQEQPQLKHEVNHRSRWEYDAALALLLLHESLNQRESEAVDGLIDLHDRCLTECTAS
ncbi:uncharacterized protein LOC142803530 [Rhipicephalus microplus]|uniref:uncharacterized protein LOC142803530 n=1 Tax=Rhipicephalus microplus TaxID=6941 RepID=UPI003F6BB2A4